MEDNNLMLLKRLSIYLNDYSDYIDYKMVNELTKCGMTCEEAVRALLSSILKLDNNKEMMNLYFKYMVKELDIDKYINNLYYKNIKFDEIKEKNWSLKMMSYKPYELFVFNDLKILDDGRVIPQIGFFSSEYKYPCILQNNREWMLITPNEIETMEKPIEDAFGNVLTYGLGLGYFAYMVSFKMNVNSITIVECDREVINLFEKYILPQFEFKNKIKIILSDAYVYANKKVKYDYVFVDIWHDPTDGVDAYLKFKELEMADTKYSYWIEDTLKYYIDDMV